MLRFTILAGRVFSNERLSVQFDFVGLKVDIRIVSGQPWLAQDSITAGQPKNCERLGVAEVFHDNSGSVLGP